MSKQNSPPNFDNMFPCPDCTSLPHCKDTCLNSRKVGFQITDTHTQVTTKLMLRTHQAAAICPFLQCNDHWSPAKCRPGCFSISNLLQDDSNTANLTVPLAIFYVYCNLCFSNWGVIPPKPPSKLGDIDVLKLSPIDVQYLKTLTYDQLFECMDISIFLCNDHVTRILGRFLATCVGTMPMDKFQELFHLPFNSFATVDYKQQSKICYDIIEKFKLDPDFFDPPQDDLGNYDKNHQFVGFLDTNRIIKNYHK